MSLVPPRTGRRDPVVLPEAGMVGMAGRVTAWLRLARPWQWHKNLLVLAAPAAAGLLTDGRVVALAAVTAVAFTMAASGTYFVNDVRDAAEDARHPAKQRRPVASGLIPRGPALAAGVVLQLCGIALAGMVAGGPTAVLLAAYVVLTLGYSFRLKTVPFVEMAAVTAGFVLRAAAGGVAGGIPLSLWFLLVATAGALFLTIGKRDAELQLLGRDRTAHRQVLGAYSHRTLRGLLIGCGVFMLAAFSAWNVEVRVRDMAAGWMVLSIVPLAVLLGRYGRLSERGHGGEPELLLVRDPVLVVSGVALGLLLVGGLHLA